METKSLNKSEFPNRKETLVTVKPCGPFVQCFMFSLFHHANVI